MVHYMSTVHFIEYFFVVRVTIPFNLSNSAKSLWVYIPIPYTYMKVIRNSPCDLKICAYSDYMVGMRAIFVYLSIFNAIEVMASEILNFD